jgi:hypothetical protein
MKYPDTPDIDIPWNTPNIPDIGSVRIRHPVKNHHFPEETCSLVGDIDGYTLVRPVSNPHSARSDIPHRLSVSSQQSHKIGALDS